VNDITAIATSAPHIPNGIFERIEHEADHQRSGDNKKLSKPAPTPILRPPADSGSAPTLKRAGRFRRPSAFGTEVPAPVDDEAVPRYRARLFNRLVRRLPEGHEWQSVRADEIPLGLWTPSSGW
jgi:hypothetical protein